MNKNDLRYQKTEKVIIDTFLQLVDEVGFENTSISLICEKAMINRKTFYLHYLDKYDLLDHIYQHLKETLMESLTHQTVADLIESNLYESVRWCITEANQHRELIRILLKSSRKEFREILIDIFSKYPARRIIANFDDIASQTKYHIISVYMCDAMIGFFEVWFHHYEDMTLEEAIDLMYHLVNEPAKLYLQKLLSDKNVILVDEKMNVDSIFKEEDFA